MSTTFIGLDLAWQSEKNDSGIAVLRGDDHGAKFISHGTVSSTSLVVERILAHSSANTVVAIDAPLIITNKTRQRPCEIEIARRFARYDAAPFPANLGLYPNPGSVRVAEMMVQSSFVHAPNPATDKKKPGRWFFEVYPHPAHVVLFHLDKIVKYKRGSIAQRRAGLGTLRSYMMAKFMSGNPSIVPNELYYELLTSDLNELKGKGLKRYEDTLDALICAYLAFFYWTWGGEKNELIGDLQAGYIVNPIEAL